ncbi:hypothetical protein KY092_07940 [Natronomonas gomsonensis]|uniref:hypothetical protein n=1 Tax=Natronomonas gomsonensis TaxID=1046043 RepID=UPI0020CA3C35|nr:hypothetical protein [Natronomonas gomsonensis]MCY4730487.1 hypothetical protein [Natronomonas gomsonensis]
MSDAGFSQESLFTYIGDPADQNIVELEQGDVIRYRKRGREMEAWFVAAEKGSNKVKIRKCENGYDVIALEEILGKLEDPEIEEGFFIEDESPDEVAVQ